MMDQGQDNAARFVGCTATVVLISPTHIICANAGDSRSVLARSSGQQCVPLSEDHKPENSGELARIHAAGGFVEENRVNGSLNLSRSLGDFEYKMTPELPFDQQMVICVPEIHIEERKASDDFIVVACDGIWDCLSSEDCLVNVKAALTKLPKEKVVSQIIEEMFDQIIATDILSS